MTGSAHRRDDAVDWPQEHYLAPHRETPFHGRIAQQMRTLDWYDWGGYTAASTVSDTELEYVAIRNSCALFDISPMTKYRVTGPDAEGYLDRLMLTSVAKLKPGRVQYTAWCDELGQVLDDGTLFRFSETEFRLCCQERHYPWLLDSALGFDVTIVDETDAVAGLAVQGPTSCRVLRNAGFDGVEALKPFDLCAFEVNGMAVQVSRTGFTGDLGYELFVAPGDAEMLWDLLWAAGRLHGIRAVGFESVNVTRLEAGFIVAGSDFVPADHAIRADRPRSPFEIGLGWMVDFDKGFFNGRPALKREQETGSSRYALVGLELEGNIPGEGSLVYHRKRKEVGIITAAAWSPTAKRNIALASLKQPYGDRTTEDFWVEVYALRELVYHKLMVRARIVDRPFVRLARRTATPPGDF